MTSEKVIYDGPFDHPLPGRDATAWRWILQGHTVIVEISDTAMQVDPRTLPPRTREARRTRGESEVLSMLDWDVPNDYITLSTDEF